MRQGQGRSRSSPQCMFENPEAGVCDCYMGLIKASMNKANRDTYLERSLKPTARPMIRIRIATITAAMTMQAYFLLRPKYRRCEGIVRSKCAATLSLKLALRTAVCFSPRWRAVVSHSGRLNPPTGCWSFGFSMPNTYWARRGKILHQFSENRAAKEVISQRWLDLVIGQ